MYDDSSSIGYWVLGILLVILIIILVTLGVLGYFSPKNSPQGTTPATPATPTTPVIPGQNTNLSLPCAVPTIKSIDSISGNYVVNITPIMPSSCNNVGLMMWTACEPNIPACNGRSAGGTYPATLKANQTSVVVDGNKVVKGMYVWFQIGSDPYSPISKSNVMQF
jgi:hypothetical protein